MTARIPKEHIRTQSSVIAAGEITNERTITHSRVVDAGCEKEKGASTLGGVPPG